MNRPDLPVPRVGPRTVGPLIAYELRRTVGHPAFLAAFSVVLLAWTGPWLADRAVLDLTVVNTEALGLQVPMLLPAAGAFLAAALVALADHRHDTSELLVVARVSSRTRLLAQAFAVLGPGAVVLVACMARVWAVSEAAGAAGRPALAGDVLSPAAVTLLAGVLATCCAHLLKSLPACGAILAVLGVMIVVGAFAAYQTSMQWLVPITLANPVVEPPVPTALLTRPAGLHVVWLLGLTALVLGLTMLRLHGLRRSTVAVCAFAAVVAGASGAALVQDGRAAALPSSDWTAAYLRPRAEQRCESEGHDTYCAFPDFASRIPYWADLVSAQRGLLPAQAGEVSLVVRQRLSPPSTGQAPSLPWDEWTRDDETASSETSVPVSTRWARPGSDDYAQNDVLSFSVLTGAALVGWTFPDSGIPRHAQICGAQGVLTAWLGTQSLPAAASAYSTVRSHTSGPGLLDVTVLGSADTVVVGEREVALASSLEGLPRNQLVAAVAQHWDELTAPTTGVADAARFLRVPVPEVERVTAVCGEGG